MTGKIGNYRSPTFICSPVSTIILPSSVEAPMAKSLILTRRNNKVSSGSGCRLYHTVFVRLSVQGKPIETDSS